jgi:hypothetical protein
MPLRIAVLIVLLLSGAVAQTTDRVFHFAPADTPAARQTVHDAMLNIAEIRYASLDPAAGALTVTSTPELLGLAEWLFTEFERTGPAPAATTVREYRLDRAAFPIVRVLFLAHTDSAKPMQEVVNAIRSIAEVRRVVAAEQPMIVLRATLDQANFAEWIVRQLDQSASSGVQDYTFNDIHSPAVRIFHPANARTALALQETINAIRSIAEVQRVVAHTSTNAILARGETTQVDLAAWLVQELDGPADGAAHEHSGPAVGPYVVKLMAVPAGAQLLELVNRIRSTTGMERIVALTFCRKLVLRGAADQIAIAERLIRDAN